jgi:transcriptional regulator with XRE-family HTH domain
MSLRDLAGGANLDYTYLSKIERGKSRAPSTEALVRIADALDADADELLALAGKVAPDVEQMLIERPSLMDVVRKKAEAVPA